MLIRQVKLQDLESVSQIEHKCFPIAEACDKEKLKDRIKTYPECFFVLQEKDKIIAFIDGFSTNEENLSDLMYRAPSLHNPEGDWQMIFGLACLPAYQHRGYASLLMNYMINLTKERKKKGLVLTCKEKLITFYEQFGYHNEGLSISTHGNVSWYQMRLTLKGE